MSHDEIPLSHTNDCDRPQFSVAEFYERKAAWSREVFGPKQTTDGVIAHLHSELKELRAAIEKPDRQIGDVADICEELADVCLLAIDLSWRAGGTAADFRGTSNCARIVPRDAADYIGRHLDSSMPPAALAAVLWDLAFRALGCDGSAIETKFSALLTRTWPDWRTVPADQPIEHVREPASIQVAGQLAAWSETSTAMVIVERLPSGALKTMRVVDLIAQWRKLGDEVTQSKVEIAKLTAERDADPVARPARQAEILQETLDAIRERLGAGYGETAMQALERSSRAARGESALLAERASWLASNEALRLERDDVRKVLAAQPHETVTMAAQRVVASRDHEGPDWRPLRQALGMESPILSFSALIERAGQLRDDSVAYRSLRGRLVEVIGAPADFGDIDLLDLLKDRINGPITDAEDDLLAQVQQLEDDVTTLKAALHVATRAVQS